MDLLLQVQTEHQQLFQKDTLILKEQTKPKTWPHHLFSGCLCAWKWLRHTVFSLLGFDSSTVALPPQIQPNLEETGIISIPWANWPEDIFFPFTGEWEGTTAYPRQQGASLKQAVCVASWAIHAASFSIFPSRISNTLMSQGCIRHVNNPWI